MGKVISIVGKSGAGKSTSFRGVIGTKECIVIRPSQKPFPFRKKTTEWEGGDVNKGDFFYTNNYDTVLAAMSKFSDNGKKIIIIDDSTFYMTDFFMSTAKEVGYEKFVNNSLGYYNMIKHAESLPEDVIVYLINHIDDDANGFKKFKTIGKMLDEKVDLSSLFTIVFEARIVNKEHKFQTNKATDSDLAKTPMGMFTDMFLDNDLEKVDAQIRNYYYLEPITYSGYEDAPLQSKE